MKYQRLKSARVLAPNELDIQGEIDHIRECAQIGEARIVTIGSLMLFATQGGDAWILEPKDALALCLAIEGKAQAVHIVNTESQFGIGWNKSFEIRENVFVTLDHETGRRIFITGYPIAAILESIERCNM